MHFIFSVATNGKQVYQAGVTIIEPCGGMVPCFPACSDQNQGWDNGKYVHLDNSLNYSQITGLDLNESPNGGNIDYSVTNDNCRTGEVR